MMRQTSLEAYELLQPQLGERQAAVLTALRCMVQATDKDLASFLRWPINRVTPRRGELVKLGRVTIRGRTIQDGRQAILWTVGAVNGL